MQSSLDQISRVWKLRIRVLLKPGLGLKRWLLLLVIGAILFSLGVGFEMAIPISPKILPILRTLTLSDLSPMMRGAVFMLAGVASGGVALYYIYTWVAIGASHRRGDTDIVTAVDLHQHRQRGPRIVAIGGGTGVSTLLRGLKRTTGNLTAIVTIADDGGSSGRLRDELSMPAPGDVRNCLVALSESESLMGEIFSYRFNSGSDLNGHSLGNLLLAALYEKRGGLHEGLEAAARLLGALGRVIPVSNDPNLILMGETVSGKILIGESAIGQSPDALHSVWIDPVGVVANESAVTSILEADLIVIGPGSLYTSVIPNFLFPEIGRAIEASKVPKVFVCNVATQPHETDGYGVVEHFKAFKEHTAISVTHVLVNSNVHSLPNEWNQMAITSVSEIDGFEGTVIQADVVDSDHPTRHDPDKLANVLMLL